MNPITIYLLRRLEIKISSIKKELIIHLYQKSLISIFRSLKSIIPDYYSYSDKFYKLGVKSIFWTNDSLT